MLKIFKTPKSYIAAFHDVIMAAASFIVSLYVRLGDDFNQSYEYLFESTLIFTIVCLAVFSFMRLYRGMWRFASIPDLIAITKSVTLAILVFLPIVFLYNRLDGMPRSIFFINWLVLILFLGAPRFAYRILKDRHMVNIFASSAVSEKIPVVLVGLDKSAELFLRYSNNNDASDYKVVAILDQDKNNKNRHVHGVNVYGDIAKLGKVITDLEKKNLAPRRVVVSAEISGEIIGKLIEDSEVYGLSVAKIPKLSDFQAHIDKVEIKPIAIEDLLGRAQKMPDHGRRKELISGKIVLITGAGGTIGSELSRQIAKIGPKKLILCEASEYNLYAIDKELTQNYPDLAIESIMANVRDVARMDDIFKKNSFDIVFHAAALKHVPLVEKNPVEAVLTNILGTKNIADMCQKHKIGKMVLISTDKAVHPKSIMGLTKRIAESYVFSVGEKNKKSKTDYSIVRFGNVLGSSGSVIPLFQSQLEKGGPITVTHPDMTRFFMTVPEAVELVLQASTLDRKEHNSAIFVLDMGTPVKIKNLAEQMIKLAGLVPDKDIKIEYTGIREGEKLHEVLFYDYEKQEKTHYKNIILAISDQLDYKTLADNLEKLAKKCEKHDEKGVLKILKEIVPDFNN